MALYLMHQRTESVRGLYEYRLYVVNYMDTHARPARVAALSASHSVSVSRFAKIFPVQYRREI